MVPTNINKKLFSSKTLPSFTSTCYTTSSSYYQLLSKSFKQILLSVIHLILAQTPSHQGSGIVVLPMLSSGPGLLIPHSKTLNLKLQVLGPPSKHHENKNRKKNIKTSLWLNQPIWKNICQIGNHPPIFGIEHRKYLKPPPGDVFQYCSNREIHMSLHLGKINLVDATTTKTR